MNFERIDRMLAESANSDLEVKLRQRITSLLRSASTELNDYYHQWERADALYRAYRPADQEDRDAKAKGEPSKIIIPIAYAQVQTALAFSYAALQQRERLWELVARGPEDQRRKEAIERDLQYQVEQSDLYFHLMLWLLSMYKYGLGIMKTDWQVKTEKVRTFKKETRQANVMMGKILSMFGAGNSVEPEEVTVEEVKDVLSYEGNCTEVVPPYHFIWDTSFPLYRFQEGEFVACEKDMWLATLKADPNYYGCEHVKRFEDELATNQGRRSYVAQRIARDLTNGTLTDGGNKTNQKVLFTEVILNMSPKQWKDAYGIDEFGDSPEMEKYLIVMLNDHKIVKIRPLGRLHNRFPVEAIEFSPDVVSIANPGLSETISELQEIMTWLLNSHMANVRATIKNRFIGVADRIYPQDIKDGKALIRVKGTGSVDNVLKQLQTVDVTRQHISDIQQIHSIIQLVTGVNDNALGAYAKGRRSATESRTVNSSAGVRLKTVTETLWHQGLCPLGKQWLSMTLQNRSEEAYRRIMGEDIEQYPFYGVFLQDSDQIAGGYDFAPFDATLPTENKQRAQLISKLMEPMLKTEQGAMALAEYDMGKLISHTFELYGVRNIKDFKRTMQTQQGVLPQVVPNEQVQGLEALNSLAI